MDLPTLRPRWQVQADYVQGEPVVCADRVMLGNSYGLYALASHDGALIWQQDSDSRVFTPSCDEQNVYAGSENGQFQARRLSNGALRWQRQFAGWVYAPAVTDKVLIIAGQEPIVRALNPVDGSPLWHYPLSQESVHYPVLADADTVIITSFSGAVLALDVNSGALRWQVQDDSANFSPIEYQRTLYFRTFAGPIVARSADDGRELWRSQQSLSASPIALTADQLAVVDSFGAVVVLASASGEMMRRYSNSNALIGAPLALKQRLLLFRDAGGANTWPLLTVIPWSTTSNEEQKL